MNHLIDAAAVVVKSNRQRREFSESEHQDLITSIGGPAGLMHAVVLRLEGDSYTLVAGERRLRAVKEMAELGQLFTYGGKTVPLGMVPFVSLGDLDPLDAKEAELEENIRRKDLSWQERAAATKELYELRIAQAASKGYTIPSMRVVAEELTGPDRFGAGTTAVKEMQIAAHLDDPDVRAASSVKEAHKILLRKEETKKNERIAEVVGRTFNAAAHSLIHGDSQAWMQACPPGTFDVVLTDPPYGMGADEFGDSGQEGTRSHTYEDSAQILLAISDWFPRLVDRVTKNAAHLYLFCDPDWFPMWRKEIGNLPGWKVFRTPLVWHKPGGFRAPWPDQGPQRKYESILFAVKGEKRVTRLAGDVLTYPLDESRGYAAQKPVGLYVDLLSRSAIAGDAVLDPFCGSGPIFPAAHDLKVKAVGIEQDAAAYAIAIKRLEELK